MIGKYAYSLNGEHYRGSFDTREAARAVGIEAAQRAADGPQTIFVGRMIAGDTKASGHARMILSNMMARAREEFGDAASQYLTNLPKPQIEQLDETLELVIRGWLHRNNLIPTFFKLEAIGEYPVPIPSQRQNAGDAEEVQEIGSGEYST